MVSPSTSLSQRAREAWFQEEAKRQKRFEKNAVDKIESITGRKPDNMERDYNVALHMWVDDLEFHVHRYDADRPVVYLVCPICGELICTALGIMYRFSDSAHLAELGEILLEMERAHSMVQRKKNHACCEVCGAILEDIVTEDDIARDHGSEGCTHYRMCPRCRKAK